MGYRDQAEFLKKELDISNPHLFELGWGHFDTGDRGTNIVISERGTAAENNAVVPEGEAHAYRPDIYHTVRARQWVLPSSEDVSGTVTLVSGVALVGVIVRS